VPSCHASISTGAFGYPIRMAAPVAMRAVVGFLRSHSDALEEVRFRFDFEGTKVLLG